MTEHVFLGARESWGNREPFTLSSHDRRHHLYTVGKSGTGKTTLLRSLLIQDIEAGRGVGLIDPHGDLAHDLLDHTVATSRHDPGDILKLMAWVFFAGLATVFLREWLMRRSLSRPNAAAALGRGTSVSPR